MNDIPFPRLYDHEWMYDFGFCIEFSQHMNKLNTSLQWANYFVSWKKKLRGLCPQANYTDRATAQRIPPAVNLGFLDRCQRNFWQNNRVREQAWIARTAFAIQQFPVLRT
jgi:hypothetical protein